MHFLYTTYDKAIFDELYPVFVPYMTTLSEFDLMMGVPVETESKIEETINKLVRVRLPIYEMAKISSEGNVVKIVNKDDIAKIYYAIDAYLNNDYEETDSGLIRVNKDKTKVAILKTFMSDIYSINKKIIEASINKDVFELSIENPFGIKENLINVNEEIKVPEVTNDKVADDIDDFFSIAELNL